MFEVCSDVVSLTRLLNSVCYIMENWLELTLSWIFSICSIMTNKIQSDLNHSQYICSYATAAKLLQSCPTLRPHRQQLTRLHRPWDSPGKNTGVGCHFLLQCMKVKSENEVTQSCLTLRDPMDCNLPGSSIHGIFQARVLEWGAIAFSEIYH